MKVIRWLIISHIMLAAGAIADPCDGAGSNTQTIRDLMARQEGKRAVALARELADQYEDCVDAQLLLAEAYDTRLDEVGGLRALSASKGYRRAIRDALKLAPNHVGARTQEIGYLIHAPGIAGGDREKASERIEALRAIDPLAAAQMQVTLARAEANQDQLIGALRQLSRQDPVDALARSELIRRQILAGQYEAAREELSLWQPDTESWVWLEHLYLSAAVKVYWETDLERAYEQLVTFSEQRHHYDHIRLASVNAAQALKARVDELRGNRLVALNTYLEVLKEEPDNRRAKDGVTRLSNQAARQ